ncbi:MAG TPA: DUF3455 domain-containing protein [Blastocatellia bacterium]|nr:DUF3455 domain-containing protein [Blastocatellia bacterium]
MHKMNTKSIHRSRWNFAHGLTRSIGMVLLLAVLGIAAVAIPAGPSATPAAKAADDNRAPELPSPACDSVQVPPGNNVAFHAYALGVQVYRWTGTAWAFVEPVAMLFGDPSYQGKVGIHYAGPTWQTNSGSKVVGARLAGCSPDPAAIPWLLLQAVSNEGPGILSAVTYIQRVNTTGGLAPAAPGASAGATVQVPYTAEYFFYRAED